MQILIFVERHAFAAATACSSEEYINPLIRNGARVNKRDPRNGRTVLMKAALWVKWRCAHSPS